MITPEIWGAFQKYRGKRFEEMYSNFINEYPKPEMPKIKKEKRKFLFWEFEKTIYPSPSDWHKYESLLGINRRARDFIMYQIPENTIESCLDWLSQQEEKWT